MRLQWEQIYESNLPCVNQSQRLKVFSCYLHNYWLHDLLKKLSEVIELCFFCWDSIVDSSIVVVWCVVLCCVVLCCVVLCCVVLCCVVLCCVVLC